MNNITPPTPSSVERRFFFLAGFTTESAGRFQFRSEPPNNVTNTFFAAVTIVKVFILHANASRKCYHKFAHTRLRPVSSGVGEVGLCCHPHLPYFKHTPKLSAT